MTKSEAGYLGYLKTKKYFEKNHQERHLNAIKKWEEENKHCLHCGARIPFENRRYNKFCNQSCGRGTFAPRPSSHPWWAL